jgi:hypothetical protein
MEPTMMERKALDAQSWVAFPFASLPPSTADEQNWVAALSGIAVCELQGSGPEWTHEQVRLQFDDLLHDLFSFAQRAPSAGHHLRFVLERAANLASINSINAMSDRSASQERIPGAHPRSATSGAPSRRWRRIISVTLSAALMASRSRWRSPASVRNRSASASSRR